MIRAFLFGMTFFFGFFFRDFLFFLFLINVLVGLG